METNVKKQDFLTWFAQDRKNASCKNCPILAIFRRYEKAVGDEDGVTPSGCLCDIRDNIKQYTLESKTHETV